MVDFITQFDEEEQPEIKMATVINQTIQNSVALAKKSTVNGWWPQVYAPTNLDLVRWKLGKYWVMHHGGGGTVGRRRAARQGRTSWPCGSRD